MDGIYVENNNTEPASSFSITEKNYKIHDLRFPVSKANSYVLNFPLQSKYNLVVKRSFDIILSSLFIVTVLSWLIPLFAIIIKLDSRGPIFFRQKRNRHGGKLFSCIKFRTMIVNQDADHLPAQLNDDRVTRFGKFLRDHYLDELPQFINVLLGDMSIVGPRPHMLSDNLKYELLIENYSYRHRVKPGITGLAQVRGYAGYVDNIKSMKDRVTMDIFYMKHWSAKLDLLILYRTFFKSLGI